MKMADDQYKEKNKYITYFCLPMYWCMKNN